MQGEDNEMTTEPNEGPAASAASEYETFLRRKAEAEEMAEIAAIISDSLFDDKEDAVKEKDAEGITDPVINEDSWVREFLSTFDKVSNLHVQSSCAFIYHDCTRVLVGRQENRHRMR